MSDLSAWSNTAGSNNASAPNGWPEGMAPSGVNDSGREVMAAVRRWYEDAQWVNFGHTPTRVDNDTFTVATDLTAIYETGRRLKVGGSATGYCTIASSSYSAPNTTVNVTMDSGNLPGTLSTVSVGIMSYTGSALPLVPDGRLSSNVPLKNAANTFTAGQTASVGDNSVGIIAAATSGQIRLHGYHSSFSGAFIQIRDGANSAYIPLNITAASFQLSGSTGGLQVGSPTGGDKGAGTFNAAGSIYVNNVAVALSDGSNLTALPAISGANLTGLLKPSNNLSDVSSASTSRTNLGVTATGADTTYAYRANNLSDLGSASTARTNLGLLSAVKTADTSRTSTTTLADDPDLTVALLAGKVYEISMLLEFSSASATPNAKIALTFTGTVNGSTSNAYDGICITVPSSGSASTQFIQASGVSPGTILVGASGLTAVKVSAMIYVNAAGNYKLQWAQSTSDGTAMKLLMGSSLVARQLN